MMVAVSLFFEVRKCVNLNAWTGTQIGLALSIVSWIKYSVEKSQKHEDAGCVERYAVLMV